MSKRRFAAVAATPAIFTSVAPATALAAPTLPGPLAGLSSIFGHSNPNNKSMGCHVDWNTSATKTGDDNAINGGVSPARGDDGVTEMQLWGTAQKPYWRTVVATDGAIRNYKLAVTLPEGYDYTATVLPSDSDWFAVDKLDNRKTPVKWTHALGSDDLNVAQSGNTVTVTVKSGTLKALDRFVIQYAGTPTGDVPNKSIATARSTGSFVDCGGNGSLGSS